MRNTENVKTIIWAYEKGYRVVSGFIINPSKEKVRGSVDNRGYKSIRVRRSNSRNGSDHLYIHQLVAYQKYGTKALENGITVRHLNGNKLDNAESNIAIGTQHQNIMDRPKRDRINHSIIAANKRRKFSDKIMWQIKRDHESGLSYKDLMRKYGITSKGTISYMINTNYSTSV